MKKTILLFKNKRMEFKQLLVKVNTITVKQLLKKLLLLIKKAISSYKMCSRIYIQCSRFTLSYFFKIIEGFLLNIFIDNIKQLSKLDKVFWIQYSNSE